MVAVPTVHITGFAGRGSPHSGGGVEPLTRQQKKDHCQWIVKFDRPSSGEALIEHDRCTALLIQPDPVPTHLSGTTIGGIALMIFCALGAAFILMVNREKTND